MTVRLEGTGINCTPKYVWVYFRDNRLVVPRPAAVRVPWGHVADVWRDLSDGVNTEVARRIQAEAEAAQWTLPGID